MIVLIVSFTVKPGSEQQTKDYIRKMQEHTRREPGCRRYAGHQSLQDPRRFSFYEVYDDQAALDAHRAAPYFAEYVTNGLGKLVESRTHELFTPVE
jgi:quinol monooxygenase YgiN